GGQREVAGDRPTRRFVVTGRRARVVTYVRLERARGMTRQAVLAPPAERGAESFGGKRDAEDLGAERLVVLELSRVAPSGHDDLPVALDRRFCHDHLGTCRVAARRMSRASAGPPVARARPRVA